MTDLTMSQFASKDDLLAAQAARIAELESQLEAIGAGGVEPLRKQAAAPQAVQDAVPDGWKRVPLKPTPEMCHVGRYGGDKDAPAYGEKPVEGVTAWPFVADHTAEQIYQSMLAAAPAHPAEGVPAQAVHQIAEPAAPVGKPIEDAIDALVWAAFTEGGCSEHRMSEARIQTELRKKELCTLIAATQPAAQGMDAIRALIAQHGKELERNHYAYFELAYTRRTGWMVWITDKPAFRESVLVNPDRKVLARGQGDTPEAACADALAAQAKQGGAE